MTGRGMAYVSTVMNNIPMDVSVKDCLLCNER